MLFLLLIIIDGDIFVIFKNVCGITAAFLCQHNIVIASHWELNQTCHMYACSYNKQDRAGDFVVYRLQCHRFHHLKWI